MKKRFAVIAMLIAVAAMLSIFTLSVYADTTTVATETTAAPTDGTTTAAGTTTATPDATTTAPSETEPANEFVAFFTDLSQVIPLAVFVVILIVLAVVFFGIPKYREKTLKLLRSLKSECKKISWFSWKNTRKATVVVIVCVVILCAVIYLLDFLFNLGMGQLSGLFS